jgi:hypothetical protein
MVVWENEVVLVASHNHIRSFGDIHVYSSLCEQAMPVGLLCALQLHTCQRSNMLGNRRGMLLARTKGSREESSLKTINEHLYVRLRL